MIDPARLYELVAHYQRRASAPGERSAVRDYYKDMAAYLTSIAEELDRRGLSSRAAPSCEPAHAVAAEQPPLRGMAAQA